MTQSSPVSPSPRPGTPRIAATPSSVSSSSPGRARRTTRPAPAEAVEVVGVGGLAELEHHVVRGVDDVVDRPHAGERQPARHPARRRPDRHVGEHPHREARAQVGRVDRGAGEARHRRPGRAATAGLGRGVNGTPEARRQVAARSPAIDQASGRLPSTVMSKTTSGSIPSASTSGHARAAIPSTSVEDHQPAPSVVESPSSRPEHSIPFETTPRIVRRAISMPPGSRVPTRASGTRSPSAKLKAPQTISRLRRPVDDHPADPVGPLDRPATSSHPGDDDVAEALAHALDALDHEAEVVEGRDEARRGRPSKGAKSRSQESGARTVLRTAGGSGGRSRSGRACRRSGGASARSGRSRSRRRSRTIPPRSMPHGREHRRVHHPAPAELDPARARARPAARAAADGAGDLVFGRGLGEGEVRRPQARVDVGRRSRRR